MRNQFTFYCSYFDAAKKLKNKEDRRTFLEGIISYALYGEEVAMTDVAQAMFFLVKPTLDVAEKKSAGAKNKKNDAGCNEDNGKIEAGCAEDNSKTSSGRNRNRNRNRNSNRTNVIPPTPYEGGCEDEDKITDEEELLPEIAAQLPPKQKDPFETFWDSYPNKQGDIRQAFIQWDGAIATTPPENIMSALEAAKAEWNAKPEGKKYIPSAEKWLRNRAYIGKSAQPKVEAAPLGMDYLQRMKDRMGGT